MKTEVHFCSYCKDEICEFNENEYFCINFKVYCSTWCYLESDKKKNGKKSKRKPQRRK
jgi:hypothetical protein